MSQEWIAIQRNPNSGRGRSRRNLLKLISALKRGGLRVRLFSRREKLDAALAAPERRASLRCLVAAGGDGTVRDLVQRYPDLPVAIFPLGTENLLAKYLQMTGPPEIAAAAVLAGRTLQFDTCEAGGQRFLLMLSAGFDADVVHRTDARRTGNISKWSYLQPLWASLRKYTYPDLSIGIEGDSQPLAGKLAVVVNVPAYAMQLPVAAGADPTDGLLDLRLFQNGSPSRMMSYLYNIRRGRHESLPDVVSRRSASFRIESEVPVPVQIDGDPAGFTPVEVRISPQPMRLIVPEHFSPPTPGADA